MRTARRQGRARGRRLTLSLAMALAAILALPALASAKGSIGIFSASIRAAHGYTVTVECSPGGQPTLDFVKGGDADYVAYAYDGPGSCSARGNLRTARIALHWPGVADVSLRGGRMLRTLRGVRERGCTGRTGLTRVVRLSGRLDLTAARYLGHTRARRVDVEVSAPGSLRCGGPALRGAELDAAFGQNAFVNVYVPRKGNAIADLTDQFATRAAGVHGVYEAQITGSAKHRLLELDRAGVGRLSHLSPVARGGLGVTLLPRCTGSTAPARNVSLTGALSLRTGVLGVIRFDAANATLATYGAGTASPAGCNGYGSVPDTPKFDNSCSQSGVCSVSADDGTNAVSFYDESDPGTQSIVSETINFGDGSATTPFTNEMTHTYASAGTYTATITVVTSNGQSQTATTPVYIGS